MKRRNNGNFKLQKPLDNEFKFLNLNQCDSLARLKGMDIQELIIDLESYFLSLRSTLGLNNNVTFGMEIEFEHAEYNRVDEKLQEIVDTTAEHSWALKSDGTVRTSRNGNSCGGEIVSPILRDTEKTWQDLQAVCSMLTDLKATAENLAGGHIHFGSKILGNSVTYWINMIKLWTIYEKVIYRFSYGDKLGARKNITFAKPIAEQLHNNLTKLQRAEDCSSLLRGLPTDRYQSINFGNVNYDNSSEYKNTIEVRCPNSSINPIVWQNNVNLFTKLFLYCKNNGYDEDFIQSRLRQYSATGNVYDLYNEIYLQEALELSDLIFTNNLDKVYFLKQYLKSFEYQKAQSDNIKQMKL